MGQNEHEEEWRPVVGCEGLYEASDLGRVRSIDRTIETIYGVRRRLKGMVLKPCKNPRGYLHVGLNKNGNRLGLRVHQIIARAFMGKSDLTIDHINGDKLDNRIENLEYVSQRENVCRYYRKNKELPIGVGYSRATGRYTSRITANRKVRALGYFDTPKEAHEKYLEELGELQNGK